MEFLAIDFETANYQPTSACALGLALVRDGQIVQQAKYLIRPPALRFEPSFTALHGISAAEVRRQPTFVQLWPEIELLFAEHLLVAHNAVFDMRVLFYTMSHYGLEPRDHLAYTCSLAIARRVWPKLRSHSLAQVVSALALDLPRHHDPQDDAAASAQILLRAGQVRGCHSLFDLCEQLKLEIRSLGRHRARN